MKNKLIVSAWPHIRKEEAVPQMMWRTSLALIPAGIMGVFIFGIRALWIILVSIIAAVITEGTIQKLRRKPIMLLDGSAVVTGILLAYNLPSSVPLWLPIVGSFVAIAIGKQTFGGLGRNIFNPALVGRAFLMAAWPGYMTRFYSPWLDGVTCATPLSAIKEGKALALSNLNLNYWDLFLGNRGGCIGEVCILALLLGAGYLLYKRIISWHAPLSFVATTGIFCWAFGGKGFFKGDFLFYILSGGLILGAFFMATDMVTTPLTKKGKLIFGFGCGLVTSIIRIWGGYPEGVSYSILLMNAATPLIDRFIRSKKLG